ncbi:condensation domain-containing protein [Streptomyces sp. NBC_01335]|uniref:condensation domain-containing protein n=1 Tax=Streptomyces sp. NBC_01335 TaxID=2903828 RepID=UPI002E14EDC4|nr:condensation domain-containing protein [Streptomyces sp. NBC_01335]
MTGPGDVRLSHAQQRFLWDEEMTPGQDDNNVILAYHLTGPVDADAMSAALDDVLRRHEVLRTVYLWDVAAEPVQRITTAEAAGIALEHVTVTDLDLPPADLAARVCADWWDSPFDLERRPPVRARLAALAPESWLLCLNVHHIAFDGQSELLLAADLGTAYEARAAGRAPTWDAVPGYREYARWEPDRIPVWAENDLPFWRKVLADPAPALLAPPETDQGARGEYEIALDAATTDRIRGGVRAARSIVLSALLHETSAAVGDVFGVDAVNLTTVSSGRFEKAHAPILGCFVNPLVLPLRGLRTTDSVTRLTEVNRLVLQALRRARLPFDLIARDLGIQATDAGLFDVMVALQAPEPGGAFASGVTYRPLRVSAPRAGFGLVVELEQNVAGHWVVAGRWRRDLVEEPIGRQVVESLTERLLALPHRAGIR